MKEILFFFFNKNKISEISNLFIKSKIKIVNLRNFEKIKSPDETGNTFEENAKIKSLYGLANFNKICFADDSGICIDAMEGQPGINSKKFLSSKKNNINIFNKIIKNCLKKQLFSAYFQTTICLSLDENNHFFFKGIIKGQISKEVSEIKGFGYDPIFIPEGYKKTFSEMKITEKNKISHRSIAISKLKKYLDLI